jgi:hypothetical protein
MKQMFSRTTLSACLLLGGVAAAWPADRSEPVPAAAKIANSKLLPTVQHRVTKLQPTRQERRFDEVGWVTSLVAAKRLGRESGRPIFVFTHDGSVSTGRC